MKWVCQVCGYVFEGDKAPEKCPQCGAPAEKFTAQAGTMEWAAEHVVGVAQGAPEDIMNDLRANFNGECSEVGMYLAMARQADREGYPEIARAFEHYAYEEANHASRYAELLGEVLADTKANLEARISAEKGACAEKFEFAKMAKAEGNDTLHDTIHEMAKDEARHAAGFAGLYKRFFK